MLIILFAHIPVNGWTMWIPARFGFSDATEIFVFCSGLASALAFGTTFATRGWPLGAARIVHRVWQVYWAHVGVFLVTAALLVAIARSGVGVDDVNYLHRPLITPFLDRTGEALLGLLTLSYVPGLFDILPMYLVILAMIPVVMLLRSFGGGAAVAAFVLVVWLAANLAGWARMAEEIVAAGGALGPLGSLAAAAGERFAWMNFPATPWGSTIWYFNPFGWQIVFFAGFAFGMGWLAPPPRSAALRCGAWTVLLLSVPLGWFRIHQGFWLPADWALTQAVAGLRDAIEPLWWKTWSGALRVVHFLALAYVAWSLVGEKGARLSAPLPLPQPEGATRLRLGLAAAALAAALAPYGLAAEIKSVAPALDAWALRNLPLAPPELTGWMSLALAVCVATALWCAAPARAAAWLAHDGWFALVSTLRRVGSQSLAVFMTSIPLSVLCGLALDHLGQGLVALALVNLCGVAILVATAYLVAWVRDQPWRKPAPARQSIAARAPAE
ncbi:OpgC protein [Rubrimonas cliftonensis]|uniref:OpgC protein n=2 Tax=Rubrimonas cliftonensis TaxID=89524 RepID=A0A1H4D4C7_9RHOB|nr:OpgC protein [Rubrimonas cliftonensis]